MKSVSVDNPDSAGTQTHLLQLDDSSRKKSSSYTNTNCVERCAPPSPRRKKQLSFGQHKSFSAEQATTEVRKSATAAGSLSPAQGRRCSTMLGAASAAAAAGGCSRERSPNRQQRETPQSVAMRRLQWSMKSFSLDSSDIKKQQQRSRSVRHEAEESDESHFSSARSEREEEKSAEEETRGGGRSSCKQLERQPRVGLAAASLRWRTEVEPEPEHFHHNQRRQQQRRFDDCEILSQELKSSSSGRQRKFLRESRLLGSLHVVLYDFKARHKDEMDLKSGYKVSCVEMSDPDWWLGKCMGRMGLFPASYVQRIREGDIIWRLQRTLTLPITNGSTTVRLYTGQIAVQQSQRRSRSSVPITLKDGRLVDVPVQALERLRE